MTKLTAVYLSKTKHVLAALTRADPPQGVEPVSALIGSGLLVRFIGQLPLDVTFYAGDLSAVTVDDQPDVVINLQNYQVVQDPVTQALQVTGVGAAGSVALAIDKTSGAGATITVSTVSTAASLAALVVLQKVGAASPPPVIVPLSIVPFVQATALPASAFAKDDTWNMFALVQTLPPVSQAIKVT